MQELIDAGNKSRQRQDDDDELSSAFSRTQGSPVTPASSLMNRQKVINVSDVPAHVSEASDRVQCPAQEHIGARERRFIVDSSQHDWLVRFI